MTHNQLQFTLQYRHDIILHHDHHPRVEQQREIAGNLSRLLER